MEENQIPPIISLHRYWVTADGIRERMLLDVPTHARAGSIQQMPADLVDAGQWWSRALALSVFYGLLHVVIDGYRELELSDEKLDKLLGQGDYVDRLRRFRNAVFHFHKDPFDAKLTEFLEADASDAWIKAVYKSLKQLFERELPIREELGGLSAS